MFWNLIALILSTPAIRSWIIERAHRTEYTPILHSDGTPYMLRYWLFNRYDLPGGPRFPRLPSIRVHHILAPDESPDRHTHPWPFRTFVLDGGYVEQRFAGEISRVEGTSYRLEPNQAHRIAYVSRGGSTTLFVTGRKRATWGFVTRQGFTPWREYLATRRSR